MDETRKTRKTDTQNKTKMKQTSNKMVLLLIEQKQENSKKKESKIEEYDIRCADYYLCWRACNSFNFSYLK